MRHFTSRWPSLGPSAAFSLLGSLTLFAFAASCDGPAAMREPAPPLYTESTLGDAELAMQALRLLGSSVAGGSGSCATCHGITRRNVRTWAEQTQVVLDTCLTDLEVTTDAAAAEMVECMHGPTTDGMSGMYRTSNVTIFSAAAHLDWFAYVFEHGNPAASWEDEYSDFMRYAGMPNEGMPNFTQEEFDIVATWFARGAPLADSLLPNDPAPAECLPFVSPEVAAHTARLATEGWSARNRAAGILMYGCTGATRPEDCLASEPAARTTTYGAEWDVVPGSTIRELFTTTYASSFWTRSSADGRFVAHGPGYTIDLQRDVAIPTDAPYDPGFFPDNSAFVWPGVVCEQSLLAANPMNVTTMEPECDSVGIGLYEHVGVGLGGGDYWVITGEFASDNGGHGVTLADTGAGFSRESTQNFLRMINTGSGFTEGPRANYPTPFEGDAVISPSATYVATRISGPGDVPLGVSMYAIENAPGMGACGGTPPACAGRPAAECGGGCMLGTCGGTSAACNTLTTGLACAAQSGCAWSGTSCSGTARACELLDGMRCPMQVGCTASGGGVCGGEPTSCAGYVSETSCAGATGCAWNVTGGTSGAVALREVARYCYPGTKVAFSYDERYLITHHYVDARDAVEMGFTGPSDPGFVPYLSQGAANVYIVELATGVRTRITNMGPGQYALFPHFRSDGWIYFQVRGDTDAAGERVMATDAIFYMGN